MFHSVKSINPLRIPPLNEGYFDVSCGENHNLFLSEQLSLISCGSNTYGQLGSVQQEGQLSNQGPQQTIFRVNNF
jgi:alpha-tubulin suppressor-like RCC1 family protein